MPGQATPGHAAPPRPATRHATPRDTPPRPARHHHPTPHTPHPIPHTPHPTPHTPHPTPPHPTPPHPTPPHPTPPHPTPPVAIPLRLDNAYTAELYTAWVALSARGPSADPTFTFQSSSWHFADCKGYITAQEGRREPDDSLQGDPICECRALAGGHPPPRHLYSHITGTWLDALLDHVDAAAGRSAEGCPATVGWLSPIQEPRICFSHAGLQVHDALPHARRALLVSHHASAKSPPPQRNPALGEYTIAISHGLLSWGDHLTATRLRLSLFPPRDTPCPLCLLRDPGDHVLSCPLDPLLRAHYHRWLAARLSQRCHAWRHCTPTAWGVLILWGNEPFLLAVDGSPAHETFLTYTVARARAAESLSP